MQTDHLRLLPRFAQTGECRLHTGNRRMEDQIFRQQMAQQSLADAVKQRIARRQQHDSAVGIGAEQVP